MKITKKKITQLSMAKEAEIGPDFLSHIIRGRRRCPAKVALRLEAATGIDKATWVWGTPEEIQEAVRQCKAKKLPSRAR
jgi:plasmid maintenance system antidote protein VapI